MTEPGRLDIVIVNYNTVVPLRNCLTSLRKHPVTSATQSILVVDNNSSDGSAEMVQDEFPECLLLRRPTNDGYGVAINNAAKLTSGQWLMFLNPDIEVAAGALDTMLDFARIRPNVGVLGPRLLLPNGQPQASAKRHLSVTLVLIEALRIHLLMPRPVRERLMLGTYFRQNRTLQVGWVSGACHLIPRHVWNEVGPLTEETFCGSDDFEYCWRAGKQGYEIWFCYPATVIHHCSVAVKQRWDTWEVEQLAVHNFHVVLEDLWPVWRLKAFTFAELLSDLMELLRHTVMPRMHETECPTAYTSRLHRRVALSWALLTGLQRPIRRFIPSRSTTE